MTKKVPIGGVFSIYMKEIFLFDSFGFERFKEFIIDDDRNILNKILFGIKKSKKKKKDTLITLRFSMIKYEKIRN